MDTQESMWQTLISFTYIWCFKNKLQHLSLHRWEVMCSCLTSIDITLSWQYINIWQMRPLKSSLRTWADSRETTGILLSIAPCFFMMDKLDSDWLLHQWPALWRAPNTAVLMSCLSGSPFGFNKLINLYLLSSGHNQIQKNECGSHLSPHPPDTPIDK